jgi:enoyl-CoA hydratase/carnithine racemase
MPRRRLLEMMMLGQTVPAVTAESWGLLTRVVPDAELDGAADELARALAARSPTAMRVGLAAFSFQSGQPLAEVLPYLREQLIELVSKEDAVEGLAAFMQKRPPVWSGR